MFSRIFTMFLYNWRGYSLVKRMVILIELTCFNYLMYHLRKPFPVSNFKVILWDFITPRVKGLL